MNSQTTFVIAPGAGWRSSIGEGLDAITKAAGSDTDGAIAIVEHPIASRVLVTPHTHTREDEYSYVIEGEIGVRIGDDIATAGVGSIVVKPRGVPRAFWNATDRPARILEIITRPGFEQFFREAGELVASGAAPDDARWAELADRYGLAFHDDWIPALEQSYGVRAV